ncbi:hypothetical protein C8J56DRAFT_497093 [Mycena floridula]|nr:hypothetical protein C8J56DRAFT_497093 [Mycena floridula]
MSFNLYDINSELAPPRAQQPSHRHATPSGPWPFLDIDDPVDAAQLSAPQPRRQEEQEEQEDWSGYPQSMFANWTYFQLKKSGIAKLTLDRYSAAKPCNVYKLDVWDDGSFHVDPEQDEWTIKDNHNDREGSLKTRQIFWNDLHDTPVPQVRVRAFFVDDMSGPVLQMLGTRFNIEPFFFSSSLGKIPSRYQELQQTGIGDHITITLGFIRTLPHPSTVPPTPTSSYAPSTIDFIAQSKFLPTQMIDTQGPLSLQSTTRILVPDLFSVHVIRRASPSMTSPGLSPRSAVLPTVSEADSFSTIISYHPSSSHLYQTTTAAHLRERVLAAGHSVYWSKIFERTAGDPTFVLVSMLWYCLYAWDEAFELLAGEVGYLEYCTLSTVSTAKTENSSTHENIQRLTHQLHVVRAHLLQYEGLLNDFRQSITFILDTPHPGLPTKVAPTPTPTPGATPASASFPARTSRRKVPKQPPPPIKVHEERNNSDFGNHMQTPEIVLGPYFDSDEESYNLDSQEEERLQNLLATSEQLLSKECSNLLNEIARLEQTRRMMDKRLGNVMALAFSNINIEDSKRMQRLTEGAVRDSAAMKQISYLTMIFLPSTFVATVFGMNVVEINPGTLQTLAHYVVTVIPLTLATVLVMTWIVTKSDKSSALVREENGSPMIQERRFWWRVTAFFVALSALMSINRRDNWSRKGIKSARSSQRGSSRRPSSRDETPRAGP